MSENSSDLGAFLAGFVIGGLVGAATAIILAPQSGAETRAQISTKGSELAHSGGEQIHHYRDTASTYTHRAGEAIANTRHQVENATGRMQDQARIVLDRGNSTDSEEAGSVNGQAEDGEANQVNGQATGAEGDTA